jgi:monoamine oxidase
MHRDLSEASYPTLYNSFTTRGAQLDQLSIIDWINETVPGGVNSQLGQLLDVAYNIEYGGESNEQSSLNLLYLLGYSGPGKLRIFGPSNEKYRIRGGNDQVPDRLAAALGTVVVTGASLVAVARTAAGGYSLTFDSGHKADVVTADHVVLALPFSILRSSVDLKRAGFRPLKLTAIRELGMGTNSKMHVQFRRRSWETLGGNGDSYSDRGCQVTWDASRAQPGRSGLLVNYTGGRIGDRFGSGSPAQRAAGFLEQIEPVIPGISNEWNGRATVDYWPGSQFTRGSYSYWKVGQYTKFAGIEGEPEGNCHFAGEHTSIDSQGYLNGAVESGERAASEVLVNLGFRPR